MKGKKSEAKPAQSKVSPEMRAKLNELRKTISEQHPRVMAQARKNPPKTN